MRAGSPLRSWRGSGPRGSRVLGRRTPRSAELTAAMQLAPPAIDADDVFAIVEQHGGLVGLLHEATDHDRAALYDAMHVSAVFDA
jgi:hypothetical protein